MNETRVTRRSAITVSLSGLVAAGLGAAVQPGQAATAETIIVHVDDLAAECQRLHAELLKTQHDQNQIEDEITNAVGWEVRNAYEIALDLYWLAHQEWIAAELARHLPVVAPTLRMLQAHIIAAAYQKPGACCTAAEGFEPI